MLKNTFPQRLQSITQRTFSIHCTIELSELLDFEEYSPRTKYLSKSENDQLQKYSLAKRQSEFFTGRICAKIAVERFLEPDHQNPPPLSQLNVFNQGDGRPFLDCPTLPFSLPEISISHSKEYAVAIASPYRCGIDIQRQENTLIRVKERFCSEKEWQILHSKLPEHEELPLLSLLWSAKEAQQKSLSGEVMPGFQQICLQTVSKVEENILLLSFSLAHWNGQANYSTTVIAGTFLNYAIAVSIINTSSPASRRLSRTGRGCTPVPKR